MTLRAARPGEPLEILGRRVEFSFFPAVWRTKGWTLSDTVFAVSPWAVMRAAVNSFAPEEQQEPARAFLKQASDFYTTAAERLSANPLLFYYAFLNLGKALLLTRRFGDSLDRATHGLYPDDMVALDDPAVPESVVGVRHSTRATEPVFERAVLKIPKRQDSPHIFRELMAELGYERWPGSTTFPVQALLAQVVVGHRQWRDGAQADERFVVLEDIEFAQDRSRQEIWLRLYVDPGNLSRFQIGPKSFAEQSQLNSAGFRAVRSPKPDWRCYEQQEATHYSTDPADVLDAFVGRVRPLLWRIASSVPGGAYRRYYLHLTPADEMGHRVGQLPALWAALFYFGSIVRYRPHVFDRLMESEYGAFVSEFVSAQPNQLLYLLASEMCRREVAQPAIA
jgi:hypothetical protein